MNKILVHARLMLALLTPMAICLPAAVQADQPPAELLGDGSGEGKSNAIPIHSDSNGSWVLLGAGSADGKNCLAAYLSGGNSMMLLGPDKSSSGALVFMGPTVPAPAKPRESTVNIHSDLDAAGRPFPPAPAVIMNIAEGGQPQGMIAIPIDMAGFLKGLREAKSIWVDEQGREVFRVENVGGVYAARDALARCMKMPPIRTAQAK